VLANDVPANDVLPKEFFHPVPPTKRPPHYQNEPSDLKNLVDRMLILAIETATQSVGVALANEHGVVAHLEIRQGRRHAETVVPAVEQLLAHAEASMADITRIAVDVGPGLFTGLRVGVATAKAYALALDVPIVPVSSLELVAYEIAPLFLHGAVNAHSPSEAVRFGCVIDARRKELYAATFEAAMVDGQIICKQSIPTFVAKPQDVRETFSAAGISLVGGDGATVYPGTFDGFSLLAASPKASVLSERAMLLEGVAADDIELDYVRAPDAEINWVTR
jgi:tRNA threonylcarbamoyladenosine biosynthesis protein TsaB